MMSDKLLTMSDKKGMMSDKMSDNTISVRMMLRNFKMLFPIPASGIRVTRRDGDDFWIYPKQMGTIPLQDKVNELVDNSTIPSENMITKKGWCEIHYEKDTEYNLQRLSVEDEDGNMVVDKKWFCPVCIEKAKGKIERSGGNIIYW